MKTLPIVTLDGPAGVGKTTLARYVARVLKRPYLDTGSMFRILALHLGEHAEKIPEPELRGRCMGYTFQLQGTGDETQLLCNGVAAGDVIRTEEVGQRASRLAAHTVVRDYLKEAQRVLGEFTPLVVEGRDMGTVVFPQARYKFFLDASPEVRAQRRFRELQARGEKADLAAIAALIRQRDELDRNRPVAPLKPAADAVLVDTSHLDVGGVLAAILEVIHRREGEERQAEARFTEARQAEASGSQRDVAFSHLDENGNVTMVDVGAKAETERTARVCAVVEMSRATLEMLKANALPKGDVLVTAKLAGIMAAKRTSDFIPLCHPLALTYADVSFTVMDEPPSVRIECEARTTARTGVEMEALMGAQVAAATIYDMCKAVQRDMVIRDVRLVHKSGGRSGLFERPDGHTGADGTLVDVRS